MNNIVFKKHPASVSLTFFPVYELRVRRHNSLSWTNMCVFSFRIKTHFKSFIESVLCIMNYQHLVRVPREGVE